MPLLIISHAQLVAVALLVTLAAASFPAPIELLPAAASDTAECARPASINDIRDELEAGGYTVRGKRATDDNGDGEGKRRTQQLTYEVDCYDGSGASTAAAVFADNILSLSACVKWDEHTPRQKILVTHAWNTLHRTSVAVMNRGGDYCLEWSMLVLDEDPAPTVRRHVAWGTREFDRQWCSFGAELPQFEVEDEDEEAVEGYMVSGAGMAAANGLYLPDGYSDGVRMFRRAGAAEGALFRWRSAGMRAMWYISVVPSGDPSNDWYHAVGTGAAPPREGWITIAREPGAYPAPRVEALPSRAAGSLAAEELAAFDDAVARAKTRPPSSLDSGVPVASLASPQVMDAALDSEASKQGHARQGRADGSGSAGPPDADPWADAGGGGVLGHGPEAARKRLESALESRKARIAKRRAARKAARDAEAARNAKAAAADASAPVLDDVRSRKPGNRPSTNEELWRPLSRGTDSAGGSHDANGRHGVALDTPDESLVAGGGKVVGADPVHELRGSEPTQRGGQADGGMSAAAEADEE